MIQAARAHYPSLQDKTVLVTGGGTGIGADIVTEFAAQSCRVFFVDVADDESRALAERLAQTSKHPPIYERCDVRDIVALQQTIGSFVEREGPVSVLVNNVASDVRHALDEVTPEFWDNNMAINQRPAFFAIQTVVPGMRHGGGAIINLGSSGWQLKSAGYPCYAVAKSSTNGLTRGLAKSLGADRIRINTVTPGWVKTEKQMRLNLTPAATARLLEEQCLPDLVQGHDVAKMVIFLASDDGAMCTGQEFVVDAGWI